MNRPTSEQSDRFETRRSTAGRGAFIPGMTGAGAPSRLPRRRKKRSMGVLSWLLLGCLSLLGLAAGAGAVLVLTLPKDFIRDEIAAQVKSRTGRDLLIAGPASFKFYPSLGFSLTDVSLSAPEGMQSKPLLAMDSLDVSVRLMPLLNREVAIERLVLQRPVFVLTVDRSGRRSWDIAETSDRRPIRLAQAGGVATDAAGELPVGTERAAGPVRGRGEPRAELAGLALGDVRIVNGTVHYADARNGARHEATSINMRLGLEAIDKPLVASGDLVWKGETVAIDANVASLKSVMAETPARIALAIKSRPIAASFTGTATLKSTLDAEGALTANAGSLKTLSRWLGSVPPDVAGFGPLDVKGNVRLAGTLATLSNLKASLDGATLAGQLSVDGGGTRPYVKGSLELSELDLNKYSGSGGAARAATTTAPDATSDAAPDGPATSIDDLLESQPGPAAPGPRVKGFSQRAGWSEGQIDASALGLADADLKLSLGRLLVNEIKIGKSQLTVALKSKALRTTLDDVQLYGGRAKGFVTLDATAGMVVSVGSNLGLDGIAAQGLLKDAAGMDWLAGTGKLTLAISGQGQSQRQIVETLNGNASLLFTNGAIVGWNIAGMLRGLSQGKLGSLDRSPSEKTDFSELSSTWNITNGLAENQDLKLASPLLRVTGSGSVMLPARELDYTLRPTLVASLEGQGSSSKTAGLEIPVRVKGGWEKPSITPDAGAILKDPNRAVEAVKELGKQFKGKSADEILKGVLGGKSGSADTSGGPTSDKEKAKQMLEGLFGR